MAMVPRASWFAAALAVLAIASQVPAVRGQERGNAPAPGVPFKVHAIDPILEMGSPDGKWAIWRKEDAPGRLYLRNLATRVDRVLANVESVADAFRWSLDSRYLALTAAPSSDRYRENAKTVVVTIPSGEVRELALPGASVQPLGWTNAGELFYKAFVDSGVPSEPGTWRYSLVKPSGGEPKLLLAVKGRRGFFASAITADGTALIGTADGGLARYDLATSQQQTLGLAGATEPIVSPDGRVLAYVKARAVHVASLDEIPVRRSIQITGVGYNHERLIAWWTGDGRFVLTGVIKYAATAYRIDLDPRTSLARGPLKLLVRSADYPKISPDGRRVAHTPYAVGESAASIGADATARLVSPDNKASEMLGWRSPQVALILDDGGVVSAWDTKTGNLSSVATFTGGQEEVVDYVPVTDEVLYQVGKGKTLVLKARAITTGLERVIPTPENLGAFAVSPDGRHIAYSRGTGAGEGSNAWTSSELAMATTDGRLEKTLATTNSRGPSSPACWSPDGKLLLYYDSKQGSTPWHVLNIETLAVRPLLNGSERAGEWLPPLIRAEQGASASFVFTGPVEWESANYPGTSWSPDGSFIVLGGYSTWREAQGKVWEGVTFLASARAQPLSADRAAPAFKVHAIDPILELGSPDGKYAIYRKDGVPRRVILRDLVSGRDRDLITFSDPMWGSVWSRDSRQIAFSVGDSVVHVISVADGADHVLSVAGDTIAWTNRDEVLIREQKTNKYLLVPAAGGQPRQVHERMAPPERVHAVTPDGRTLLTSGNNRLATIDLDTGVTRELVRMTGARNPVVSDDGRLVAFVAGSALYVVPINGATPARPVQIAASLTAVDLSAIGSPSMWWTADGQLVVPNIVNSTENLYRIDMDARTGRARGAARLLARNADHPSVAPDSRHIAHTRVFRGFALGIVDASGGPERSLLAGSPTANLVLGWRSPSVVVLSGNQKVTTIDITTASQAAHFDANGVDFYVPASDEVLLQAKVGPTTQSQLKARNLTTGLERTIATIDRLVEYRVSPDRKFLAYSRYSGSEGRSELHILSLEGSVDRVVFTSQKETDPTAWSPDGRFVLFLDWAEDNAARVLDVTTSRSWPLTDAPDHPFWWYAEASWAPDGSFVVLAGDEDWKDPVGKVFEGVTEAAISKLQGEPKESGAKIDGDSDVPPSQVRSRVAILGTGTPNADPDRWGPAVAVVVGDQSYLVDAGVGVVRRAAATAMPALRPQGLQRVFITHLHSDHTLGLPDLMFSPWVLNRPTPLDVYGPAGIEEMTAAIEKAWSADIGIRLNGGEPQTTRNYKAVTHRLKAGRVYEDANVKVDAISVLHGAWPEAYGFRFEMADRVVVISGDTRPAQSIADACNGCDVLIHEVYAPRATRWEAYDKAFHTSTAELADLATKAHPRLLVLYHTLAASPDVLVAQIRAAGYKGLVVVAQDLDVY